MTTRTATCHYLADLAEAQELASTLGWSHLPPSVPPIDGPVASLLEQAG